MTAPITLPKTYAYKVYNAGVYIGMLPVSSEFTFSLDINSSGSQITVTCPVSVDTSAQNNDVLTDESGVALTDESSNTLTTEGQTPIVSPGNFSNMNLIRNGNKIKVYEYSYFNLNGKLLFSGVIERWEAIFGDDTEGDSINLTVYSDGQDLDNRIVQNTNTSTGFKFPTTTPSPGPNNNWVNPTNAFSTNGVFATWTPGNSDQSYGGFGLSIPEGATITGIEVIVTGKVTSADSMHVSIMGNIPTGEDASFGTSVSSQTYGGPGDLWGGSWTVSTFYDATFHIDVGPGTHTGGGATGYPFYLDSVQIKVYYDVKLTEVTFVNADPSDMLTSVIDNYVAQGGLINYAGGTVDTTGTNIAIYTFNTKTVNEGLQEILNLSPANFYYYVDIGSNTIHFKETSTTADVVLTKGVHMNKLALAATIEQVVNTIYFTGGDIAGTNLFISQQDDTSVANYGPRLDRPTDNSIIDSGVAAIKISNQLDAKKNEQYQTTITIVDKSIDTTLLKPGMVVGFRGFGTFVDNILIQITRVDYSSETVTLTLGSLPLQTTQQIEAANRSVLAINTINNPSNPS